MTAIDEIDARFAKYQNACDVMISRDEWESAKKEIEALLATNDNLTSYLTRLAEECEMRANERDDLLAQYLVADHERAELLGRVAGLCKIKADAVQEFVRELGLYDPGYDYQGYIEVSRAMVKIWIDQQEKANQIEGSAALGSHLESLSHDEILRPSVIVGEANQIEGGE